LIKLREHSPGTVTDEVPQISRFNSRCRPTFRWRDCTGLIFLLLLFGLLLPANALRALAGDGNTLLILDASGSMWGRVQGRSKIETARDVIVDLLATNPTQQKLGLMSYGHRRKGDCSDIELLVPPARHTNSSVQSAVKSIKPRGKTPLSASVIEAARILRSEHEKATVILVSDGRETCDYDPCQVARELEASGVDFTAHVIGFNVKDPIDLTQLRCMAENTGGQFIAASNGDELSRALQAVSNIFKPAVEDGLPAQNSGAADDATVKATNDAERIASETGEVQLEVESLHSNETLSARANRDNRGQVQNRKPATIEDRLGGTGSTGNRGAVGEIKQRDSVTGSGGSGDGFTPGQQIGGDVEGVVAEMPASDVPAVKFEASLTVPPVLYTLQVFTARWIGPGLAEDLIAIAVPGKSANVWIQAVPAGSSGKLKLVAPERPGEYEVRYVSSSMQILAATTVTVRKAEATLIAPKMARSGRLVRIRWKGGTRDPKDSIVIARRNAPLSSAINRRFIRAQTSVMLLMPSRSGDYELRYIQAGGNLIASQSIVVK